MYEHPQEHFQAETDEKIRMVQPHHEKWTFLLYILKKSATSGMICRIAPLQCNPIRRVFSLTKSYSNRYDSHVDLT